MKFAVSVDTQSKKRKKMKRAILILAILIAGCTSTGTFTDPEGNVWVAEVTGYAESEMKTKDISMKIKRKPLLEIPSVNDLKIGGED